jgi:excisionase family DNA binding protein
MAPLALIDVHNAVPTGAAARYLGVSDSYVRRLMRGGRLRSIPTPLGHLIPRRALEEFSRARERAIRSPGRTP